MNDKKKLVWTGSRVIIHVCDRKQFLPQFHLTASEYWTKLDTRRVRPSGLRPGVDIDPSVCGDWRWVGEQVEVCGGGDKVGGGVKGGGVRGGVVRIKFNLFVDVERTVCNESLPECVGDE